MRRKKELHHGIPASEVPAVLNDLGVAAHTEEDCMVGTVLGSATDAPVIVDGPAVWVLHDQTWTRWRIPAGTRRRILQGPFTGEVTLEPWTPVEANS